MRLLRILLALALLAMPLVSVSPAFATCNAGDSSLNGPNQTGNQGGNAQTTGSNTKTNTQGSVGAGGAIAAPCADEGQAFTSNLGNAVNTNGGDSHINSPHDNFTNGNGVQINGGWYNGTAAVQNAVNVSGNVAQQLRFQGSGTNNNQNVNQISVR